MSVTHSGSVKRWAGWVSESAPGGSSRRFLVNPLGTVTGEQGALLLTRLGRAARLVREALGAVLRTLAGHFSARATAPGCEGGPWRRLDAGSREGREERTAGVTATARGCALAAGCAARDLAIARAHDRRARAGGVAHPPRHGGAEGRERQSARRPRPAGWRPTRTCGRERSSRRGRGVRRALAV